jgi:hypothetical protein
MRRRAVWNRSTEEARLRGEQLYGRSLPEDVHDVAKVQAVPFLANARSAKLALNPVHVDGKAAHIDGRRW